MCNLDFLEHPRATQIILELYSFNREIFLGELSEKIHCSNTTLYKRLDELKKANIIEDRYDKTISGDKRIREKRFLRLTKQGKEIAEKIMEIKNIYNPNSD